MYRWARAAGLLADPVVLARMHRTGPEVFVGHCYPQAGPEQLALLCRFALWSWVIDDALEETAGSLAQTARAVADLTDAMDGRALDDQHRHDRLWPARQVYAELCAGRSPGWQEAFRAESAAWLGTLVTEAAAGRLRQPMALGEYLAHRSLSSNIRTCMHLAEYAADIDLPQAVRNLPALAQARSLGAQWCGLYNDLRSVTRDIATGQQYNAVLIVQQQNGRGLQHAARQVAAIADRLLYTFQSALRELPAEPVYLRVAEAYRHVVRGNYDFHNSQPRYSEDVTLFTQRGRTIA
ncbi:terpene synthase family protein [Kitasatospora azatica]|uniref:terpene synthase family protein n=1 Tax=Kitasatospora azatica TaxID=58347 RepID=UPI000563474A|nr:terpene synthase family protein [Kitasatospora azatica]